MQNLANPAVIRDIMRRHGFRFSKKMGQNFIIDAHLCPRIAEAAGAGPDVAALEIGPGIGVLTAELAKRCGRVVAVELDKRLPAVLAETLAEFPNVEVVCGDILRLDLHELFRDKFSGMDVIVCANLPYYITSPVLMALLEAKLPVRSITVMVQKEAAERICAPMPGRQAGAITAAIRWRSVPRLLFAVKPGCFMPPPGVMSAVIRLDMLESPPFEADEAVLFRVVKAAFSQRRKTLENCLSSGLAIPKPQAAGILGQAGIPPSTRAEQLSLADFAAIANAMSSLGT